MYESRVSFHRIRGAVRSYIPDINTLSMLLLSKPQLVFLVTQRGQKTLLPVKKLRRRTRVNILTYDDALDRRSLPGATYVFTDMDRLSPTQLRQAAALFRHLAAHGIKVLNDPAKAATRAGLLRALHEAGINDFNAYRVEERICPSRWPVFLRTEGSHTAPLSGLLHNWDDLQKAVDTAATAGFPLSSMIIIEYAAEPTESGLYRKLASFRFGQNDFAHLCVHDDTWLVKYGKMGIATPALYADELRIVRDNPYAETLSRVFELASISYGRVDFGLVKGRLQIYEINTNPSVTFPVEHPSPDRVGAYAIFKKNYLTALDIAASNARRVAIPVPLIQNKNL